jgi:hypothetical protein
MLASQQRASAHSSTTRNTAVWNGGSSTGSIGNPIAADLAALLDPATNAIVSPPAAAGGDAASTGANADWNTYSALNSLNADGNHGSNCAADALPSQQVQALSRGNSNAESAVLLMKRWPAKFGQRYKWKPCLKAASMPRIRSNHGTTSTADA